MVLANCEIDSIVITNDKDEIVVIICDDDIIEKDGYKVRVVADKDDYKYRVYKDGQKIELISNQETDILS
jgi:hypothetical protein